jgi:hypothetical protein
MCKLKGIIGKSFSTEREPALPEKDEKSGPSVRLFSLYMLDLQIVCGV